MRRRASHRNRPPRQAGSGWAPRFGRRRSAQRRRIRARRHAVPALLARPRGTCRRCSSRRRKPADRRGLSRCRAARQGRWPERRKGQRERATGVSRRVPAGLSRIGSRTGDQKIPTQRSESGRATWLRLGSLPDRSARWSPLWLEATGSSVFRCRSGALAWSTVAA